MVNVSADIQWQIIRKTSSFLRRQRGIPKHFSRERFNIKGVNSIRFNGLVHKKGLDIQASPDGKGIVVAVKKRNSDNIFCKVHKKQRKEDENQRADVMNITFELMSLPIRLLADRYMKGLRKTYFPSRSNVSVTLKKNSRKSLKSVKNIARSYQNAHKGLVQKRASQLLRSLKPVASRRGRHVRKAEV
ncbi:unnamed protein product [Acanthocheilonema viteae]|uniref:Large ribosomal subunit protein eL28 n=1 Tax=Acanthocheilonema viteae TaxID=6277 RepID=A0A498SFH9_ACAVI|nr:unnamed protein product [Acanthocheilonema viteae]